jgi:uncharacterized membrane protein HdeD (DUF308 family)
MLVNYTRKYEKVSILASALMLIVALFLIFKPEESLSLITVLFGLVIMIDGVIHIINYFKIDQTQKLMSFELIEGLIEVFAGAVIAVCADSLITFLPIIFAVWIILKSLITFQMALNIKTVPNSSWGLMLFIAIVGIVLGFLVIFNPFEATITVTTLVGLVLLVVEILNIIDACTILYHLKEEK